jgi:hypothetical protein
MTAVLPKTYEIAGSINLAQTVHSVPCKKRAQPQTESMSAIEQIEKRVLALPCFLRLALAAVQH